MDKGLDLMEKKKQCPYCKSEINEKATVCPFCGKGITIGDMLASILIYGALFYIGVKLVLFAIS